MTPRRHRSLAAAIALLLLVTAAGCGGERPGALDRKAIAEEGFIYGLPIVMNYAVQYSFVVDSGGPEYKGPYNALANDARVFTWQDTTIVTPNSDTPYSMVWLDLRAEPVVISVPDVDPKRYYSVQMVDGNTFNHGYIGTRTTGNGAGSYLVAGPDWQGTTPAGIKQVFRATTQFGLTIFRTQLFGPDDMPNVVKVQAGYKVQPLSAFLGQPAPAPAASVAWPKINTDMVKTNFFSYLAFALQFAPAGPEEAAIRARLASIGIRPGEPFDFEALPADQKLEMGLGMKEGEKKVEEAMANIPSTMGTGCSGPPPPRPESSATTPWRPCTRWPRRLPTARHLTAHGTTTR